MKYVAIVTAIFAVLSQPSFAACSLTSEDFNSLRASPSKIQDQRQVDALSGVQRDKLCKSRENYKKYHVSGGPLQRSDDISRAYLSPQEEKEFSVWLNAYLDKQLASPGAQKSIDELRKASGGK